MTVGKTTAAAFLAAVMLATGGAAHAAPKVTTPPATARPATTPPATAAAPAANKSDTINKAYAECWRRFNDGEGAMPYDLSKFKQHVRRLEQVRGRALTYRELVDECLALQSSAFDATPAGPVMAPEAVAVAVGTVIAAARASGGGGNFRSMR